jgi:Zn finger protein HypA/HybF involved in hydrogenase expression
MNLNEWESHKDDNDGYCIKCEEWTSDGYVEPDAWKYRCPKCGNHTMYGAEELIIMGVVG